MRIYKSPDGTEYYNLAFGNCVDKNDVIDFCEYMAEHYPNLEEDEFGSIGWCDVISNREINVDRWDEYDFRTAVISLRGFLFRKYKSILKKIK